ncbi:AraC family ligand binding domain-containing protein [Ruthenibacterium lactatiformans]|uniref:AraC family ligand binding domain-containing protein n=1 Tax=Ruthenibacterium lactatiformans TaxID=1550024 RepID=UPI003B981469
MNLQRGIEVEKLLCYIKIPVHKHGFIESVYVLSGQCRHTVDGQIHMQGPGCLSFLNPGL